MHQENDRNRNAAKSIKMKRNHYVEPKGKKNENELLCGNRKKKNDEKEFAIKKELTSEKKPLRR